MKEHTCIVVVHRCGSVERHYLTDIRIPSDSMTGTFWFVTDEVKPRILRIIGYTDHHTKNQGVNIHPLTKRNFKRKKKSGWFLLVEEMGVPDARSMTATQISTHFNWPLVRRW